MAKTKTKSKSEIALENEIPRQTRAAETARAAIRSLAHHPARRPQPAPATPIRRRPGNHAGPRAAEKRMHRPRAQPPQRATHLHPRRRAQVLDRRQRNRRPRRRSPLHPVATCRTKPRRWKTPSISTYSLRPAPIGSTRPTNISEERNNPRHASSPHFRAGSCVKRISASAASPAAISATTPSQNFRCAQCGDLLEITYPRLERRTSDAANLKSTLAPTPPLAVGHRSQRRLALPRSAARARKRRSKSSLCAKATRRSTNCRSAPASPACRASSPSIRE